MGTSREAELRKLLKEDPKAFKKAMEKLQRQLEDEGLEIKVEILYDN